jgi:hypothetical protein
VRDAKAVVTEEQLQAAVESLYDSLAKFSVKEEDLHYRGQVEKARVLSERQMIEAGMKRPDPAQHESTKPAVSLEESVKLGLPAAQKRLGIDPDLEYENKAETIGVGNKQQKLDRGRTQELRKVFIYRDSAKTVVAWKETSELRDKIATQIEAVPRPSKVF